ncbi:MAG: hypothetical protein MZU95_05330 [Desulfomicrobium escambiense]|nr:hypothetical protein [Desulfomicrobium escambiense]
MQKPDGLTIIRAEEIGRVLENLPITDLCGVGRRLGRQLRLLGITTCGELGRFPVEILKKNSALSANTCSEWEKGSTTLPYCRQRTPNR